MFKDARELDRQLTASSFDRALERYGEHAESWFDGSVGSVDRRLVACTKLIHSAHSTVARLPLGHVARYVNAAQELESDRRALHGLREDMLNGASNREDVVGPPGWRTAKNLTQRPPSIPKPKDEDALPPARKPQMTNNGGGITVGSLDGLDRRWVELEAAKFIAANADTLDDSHELATRAANYAEVKTSTFTRQRSAAVTQAFVAKVVGLGDQAYVPTTVRTAAVDVDFDPQAMFLL